MVKRFGNTEILKGINLSVEKGDFLVLVGPSGCGKSTLLSMIAGLEPISSGEVRINGRRVNELHPSQRDIAMVFQSYALYPNMTVGQNIAFGLEMRRVPKAEREASVTRVADILQMAHLLKRKPSQLSGGQRQRVAMGRALVRDPQVFLFDEPLSNLDAKLRVDMRTEIKKLHERMRTTIVYVTHDQIEAMTLATQIAVMKDGEVLQFGSPAEIYNNPANLFVADFMGSPAMNLVPASVRVENGKIVVVLARFGEDDLVLVPGASAERLASQSGKTILFGIRPEAITDVGAADRNARTVAIADCQVDVVEPTGSDTFVITSLGGKQVIARMRSDVPVKSGERMPFAFNMDKAVFFDPATEKRVA